MPSHIKGSFARKCETALEELEGTFYVFTSHVARSMEDEIRHLTPVDVPRVPVADPKHGRLTSPLRHRSGALRDSIEHIDVKMETHGTSRVFTSGAKSDLYWASFVEDPTAPHPIHPRHAKQLVFWWENPRRWDAKRGFHVRTNRPRWFIGLEGQGVWHPGTRGVHMFARGTAKVEATLEVRAERTLEAWAKENFR